MYNREEVLRVISDVSKEAYGFRVRKDYAAMSDEELFEEYESLWHAAALRAIEEAAEALNAQRKWEQHLDKIQRDHGVSRDVALRWDMEAMETGEDLSFYCYQHGIDYTLADRIAAELDGEYVVN